MDETSSVRLRPELLPLAAACVLAPWLGGQVSLDAMPLAPGSFFDGLMGGPELPLTLRAVVGLLILVGLGIVLATRRVLPSPVPRLGIPIVGLVLLMLVSVTMSAFPYISYAASLSWVVYGSALYLAVAAVGRGIGVRIVLWYLAAGASIAAARGILEYSEVRAVEPSYRIFGGYNNPNALAALLVTAFPIAAGLGLTGERVERLAGLSLASMIGFALVLTQSRGGYLALAIGLAAFFGIALAWRVPSRRVAGMLTPLAATAVLGGLVVATAPQVAGTAVAFQRVAASADTSEQSAGFRSLLWRNTVQMVAEQPQGYGVGTYRFESARLGLVPQTYLAHQAWLQTAADGGVIALLALLALAVQWTIEMNRGARALPADRNLLRAAVTAAVVAAGAHGFFESNLSYFGVGFTVFVLLGCGIQLASDASQPEMTIAPIRRGLFLFGCLLPALALIHVAALEVGKAAKAGLAAQGGRPARPSALESIDGEAWFLYGLGLARSGGDPAEARRALRQAVALQPSTRFSRLLSDAEARADNPAAARRALEDALRRDPNNLPTLERLYRLHAETGEADEARRVAERLVAVESTPYFQVRAVPELVPLETYDARLFLARVTTDPTERIRLLAAAAEGFARFRERTWPIVRRFAKNDLDYLGVTEASARAAIERGQRAAEELKSLAGAAGDTEMVARAEALASRLAIEG